VTVDVSVGVIVRVAVGVPVGTPTVPGAGTIVRVGGAPGNVVGRGGSAVTEG